MDRKLFSLALGLLSVALTSCSGPSIFASGGSGGSPGTPGSATVSISLTATPLTPPPATSLLSFSATVAGISLTPASGTAVNIPLVASSITVDLTKLQTDSALLASAINVPVGSYTGISVSFQNLVVTYCTVVSGTPGCVAGSVKQVAGTSVAPSATFTSPVSLASAQETGFAFNVNLAQALTVNATTQAVTAVNVNATNAISASALPATSTSLSTGQLDFIENVSGVVSTVNGQIVTLQTASRGTLTVTANSSTDFSPNCSSLTIACAVAGEVASIDAALNADGSLTMLEFDPLDTSTTTHDWVEGVVIAAPGSTTQFQLVTNDLVRLTTGSLIASNLPLGSLATVNVSGVSAFTVDSKGLTVPANSFGGTDASILVPGQTVAVRVTSFTAASGSVPASLNADMLTLRFTSVPGTVSSASLPLTFAMTNLPPFFGVTTPQVVQLSSAPVATNFDGVNITSGLTASQTVSVRGIFFGPTVATPLSAAKVRVP
ncbi:MAG TPA: DUF4382 domain-containing protein [Candidatus Acidoferrum sp.]|jgi:hypothetical protein